MPLTHRHLAIAATLVVVGVAGWFARGAGQGGEVAPQVVYTLLNGQRLDAASLKGQVVLVNFWATSCSTCVAEMPEIVATFENYRARGYQTVAVAMRYDPPALVANFAESRRLPFGVAIDNTGAIAHHFGDVELTPTSFLINKRGEIVRRYVGKPNFVALRALIEKLLAEA